MTSLPHACGFFYRVSYLVIISVSFMALQSCDTLCEQTETLRAPASGSSLPHSTDIMSRVAFI